MRSAIFLSFSFQTPRVLDLQAPICYSLRLAGPTWEEVAIPDTARLDQVKKLWRRT